MFRAHLKLPGMLYITIFNLISQMQPECIMSLHLLKFALSLKKKKKKKVTGICLSVSKVKDYQLYTAFHSLVISRMSYQLGDVLLFLI